VSAPPIAGRHQATSSAGPSTRPLRIKRQGGLRSPALSGQRAAASDIESAGPSTRPLRARTGRGCARRRSAAEGGDQATSSAGPSSGRCAPAQGRLGRGCARRRSAAGGQRRR
jgi:hypothetical protein